MHRNTRLFTEVVSLIFILLFIYTAFHKFTGMDAMRHVLHRYPVIGAYPLFFSWTLPLVEVTIACLLYFKKTNKAGLLATTVLMGIFTVYVALMLITTPQLPCTCGGFISELTWPQHLVLNTGLWLAAAAALRMKIRGQKASLNEVSYSL